MTDSNPGKRAFEKCLHYYQISLGKEPSFIWEKSFDAREAVYEGAKAALTALQEDATASALQNEYSFLEFGTWHGKDIEYVVLAARYWGMIVANAQKAEAKLKAEAEAKKAQLDLPMKDD